MANKVLTLKSPANHKPVSYKWPLREKHEAEEIMDTIRLVGKECPAVAIAMRGKMDHYNENSYEDMCKIVDMYNKTVTNMLNNRKTRNTANLRLNERPSKELLKHILTQVYNNAISNAEELNKYEAFSSETYGETSFEQINQIIEELSPTKQDKFIDLGSGIGQVVLHMAALTDCQISVGIEKAPIPAKKSNTMDSLFKKWMAWYGKKYSEYKLYQGDFLDKNHNDTIIGSTIVFVNNFAFGPALDYKLKNLFEDLEEGTRIVSNKAFCPLDFRITNRNLTDIGTILKVRKLDPIRESAVSWTDQPVSYYMHVKDSTMLERYFNNSHRPKALPASSKSRVTSSDQTVCNEVEEIIFEGIFAGGFLEAVHDADSLEPSDIAETISASSSPIISESKRHKSCPSPLRECSNTHASSLDQNHTADAIVGALSHYSSTDSEFIRYSLRQLSKENKIVFHICTFCDKKFRYVKGLQKHTCRKGKKRIES